MDYSHAFTLHHTSKQACLEFVRTSGSIALSGMPTSIIQSCRHLADGAAWELAGLAARAMSLEPSSPQIQAVASTVILAIISKRAPFKDSGETSASSSASNVQGAWPYEGVFFDLLSALIHVLQRPRDAVSALNALVSLRCLLKTDPPRGPLIPPSLRLAMAGRIEEEPEALESVVAAAKQAPCCWGIQEAAFGLLLEFRSQFSSDNKMQPSIRILQRLLSAGLADAVVATLCSLTAPIALCSLTTPVASAAVVKPSATTQSSQEDSGSPQLAAGAGWASVRAALTNVLLAVSFMGEEFDNSFRAAVHRDLATAAAVGTAFARGLTMEVESWSESPPPPGNKLATLFLREFCILGARGADVCPASYSTIVTAFAVESGAQLSVLAALNRSVDLPPTSESAKEVICCLVILDGIAEQGCAQALDVAATRSVACRCLVWSTANLFADSGSEFDSVIGCVRVRLHALRLLSNLDSLPGMSDFSLLPDAAVAFSAVCQQIVHQASDPLGLIGMSSLLALFCELIEACPAASLTAAKRAEEALKTGVIAAICKVCFRRSAPA